MLLDGAFSLSELPAMALLPCEMTCPPWEKLIPLMFSEIMQSESRMIAALTAPR